MSERLVRLPDGEVSRLGVETPRGTKILRETKTHVAIRIPGHKYWSGRAEQSYAPAEIIVYEKLGDDDYYIHVNHIFDFNVRGN